MFRRLWRWLNTPDNLPSPRPVAHRGGQPKYPPLPKPPPPLPRADDRLIVVEQRGIWGRVRE